MFGAKTSTGLGILLEKYEIHILPQKAWSSPKSPHKRNGPVQCTNCQEYGHTRAYCSLRTVCVACGDFHNSANCFANKEDQRRPQKEKMR